MPRSDEHTYDELIRESERILRDVGAPGVAETQRASDAAQGRQELASLAPPRRKARTATSMCGSPRTA